MQPSRTVRTAVVIFVLAIALGGAARYRYGPAAAFVARAAGVHGVLGSITQWPRQAVSETPLDIASRGGTLRGRRYQPSHATGRTILLVPGVHAAGIDEPRLIGFARELGSLGHPVVAVELPDLMRYGITTRTTDLVEDAALWLARQPGAARDGRVGMIGISFAGGLAIVAAGRPALRDHAAFVLSFGGHGDLPRTLKYLSTGIQPDGSLRQPHDYGVAIILLGVADAVVPAAQVEGLRTAIRAFLEASRLDMIDKTAAAAEFARARQLGATLAEPARTLMTYVNTRDVGRLGPILLPHVDRLADDPALSPERSPPPACPIYLLHGNDDNVIPAVESTLLAEALRQRGVTVHQLSTPLVTHASVDKAATLHTAWALVRFWGGVMRE